MPGPALVDVERVGAVRGNLALEVATVLRPVILHADGIANAPLEVRRA